MAYGRRRRRRGRTMRSTGRRRTRGRRRGRSRRSRFYTISRGGIRL